MENDFKKYITGLQHIGIPTNDIEKTKDFYELLGFQVVFETVNQKTDERVSFLKLDHTVIETYENKHAVLENGALDHIALNVTNIEAVYKLATKKGFSILEKGIQFLPFWERGVRFFTITGPNKEKVEFSQYL
ncbi:glyoxalase/bleomycin resistance/dioxygenase family protein [Enterocloster clostridioformis]|uniref:VOC family protein n=1 Tax=Enterocloster clostridioformis TaxID=1531 RepID=UPI00080CA93A|nr:VOC family protein [Enterocloster clostridioformis]ANU46327.1 glyoxalase/bleomycin resistance/dioxygenase family protein [Lachnoclostridium sp. YL32]NDO31187.1 VOC family protein [Enterocloster clostridioformis]OXE65050.1 glyoxalase/bleomycin resistance/dioxygenase family protein [Enterocloster clostridioformis]QQQ98947.1 VOC family protein [Enterocloster clostridioformis]